MASRVLSHTADTGIEVTADSLADLIGELCAGMFGLMASVEPSEDNRYLRECRYGSFRRDVMLPEGVDADKIRANYDNGILTVMVPMPEEQIAEPRTVKVEVRTATSV